MEITELLATFADPAKIKTMPPFQLLVGGLFTTLLGMGVTFVALIALQYLLVLFEKLPIFKDPPTQEAPKRRGPAPAKAPVQPSYAPNNEELVAAITVSLATMLETSASGIRIRSIRRIEDTSPAWARVGRLEQMLSRV